VNPGDSFSAFDPMESLYLWGVGRRWFAEGLFDVSQAIQQVQVENRYKDAQRPPGNRNDTS
jgi:hypothetical protein